MRRCSRGSDQVRKLYQALTEAKKKSGEAVSGNLDSFSSFVQKKTEQIRKQYGCEAVEYTVEMQNGQVKLKAKAKSIVVGLQSLVVGSYPLRCFILRTSSKVCCTSITASNPDLASRFCLSGRRPKTDDRSPLLIEFLPAQSILRGPAMSADRTRPKSSAPFSA